MDVPLNKPVSQQELIRLAVQFRKDLVNFEEKLGNRQGFAQVMNSATALISAITEPEEFWLFASPPKKASQAQSFPGRQQSIPTSLH